MGGEDGGLGEAPVVGVEVYADITDKGSRAGPSLDSPEPIEITSTAIEDLEEGECTSDEEVFPEPVEVSKEPETDSRSHKDNGKRSQRSRSRERLSDSGKRRKETVGLSAEEVRRRDVLRKLKALESDMGLDHKGVTPAVSEESESDSSDSRSRSSSLSSPRKKEKKRKRYRQERERDHKRRKNKMPMQSKKSDKPCHLFMTDKCPKPAHDCFSSHNTQPSKVSSLLLPLLLLILPFLSPPSSVIFLSNFYSNLIFSISLSTVPGLGTL